MNASVKALFRPYWKAALIWVTICGVMVAGALLRWDKKLVAAGLIIFGVMTQAFSVLLGLVGAVPVVGPLVIKVVTFPFILLVNGIGYLVTFFALRRGYKVDVVKARVLVSTFLIGMILGFLLGRFLW